MAIINKTGIGEGNLIDAEHVTRIIDSLDGTGAYSVAVTGSFTGSFIGDGSQLTGIVATNVISSSYAATASYLDGTISSASYSDTAVSASFATTASRSITSATASFIQGSSLKQNLSISGSLSVSTKFSILQTEYITTTNSSTTDVLDFPKETSGTGYVIEAMVIGLSGSAVSGNPGTIGGNFIGVFSANDLIVGQTSSSFYSGFTTSDEPKYGLRYTGSPIPNLKFYVKGLSNETIDWTISIRTVTT